MSTAVFLPGGIALYHGDARDVLAAHAERIDAIVTDPPYGVDFAYERKRSRRSGLVFAAGKEKLDRDRGWKRIIGDDQPFDPAHLLQFPEVILWGGNNFASRLPDTRGWLIWNKLAGKKPSNFGDCEMAWTNKDMPTRIHTQLWRGLVRAGEENVTNGPKLHPAQKPVALMAWCLGFIKGRTICDPYMGCGSTGVACVRAGRPFIGIELDPDYFETAVVRLRREVEKQASAGLRQAA